jgi:tetratricopeptide (TPR) repeat protein
VAGAVVLLLSMGGGGYWLYQRYLDQQDKEQFTTLYNTLNTWRRYQKYDEAIREYSEYVPKARTVDHRTFAYLMMGSMYEQKKDYANALVAYRQAETAGTKNKDWILGYEAGIARSAQRTGDTALAITYYEKAAALAQQQDLVYSAETAEMYRQQVRALKGEQ